MKNQFQTPDLIGRLEWVIHPLQKPKAALTAMTSVLAPKSARMIGVLKLRARNSVGWVLFDRAALILVMW